MNSASAGSSGSPGPGDLPDLSFGFIRKPPAERLDGIRVLRDVTLLYLSLDLEPGPYGSIPRALEVTHQCPPEGSGLMPCCGKTPFEVSRRDRITLDQELVTCGKPESGSTMS